MKTENQIKETLENDLKYWENKEKTEKDPDMRKFFRGAIASLSAFKKEIDEEEERCQID